MHHMTDREQLMLELSRVGLSLTHKSHEDLEDDQLLDEMEIQRINLDSGDIIMKRNDLERLLALRED